MVAGMVIPIPFMPQVNKSLQVKDRENLVIFGRMKLNGEDETDPNGMK